MARRGGAKGKAAVGSDRDDDLMPDSPAVAKKSPAQGKGKAKVKSAAKVVEEDDEDDEDEAKGGEDGFSAGFVRHKIKDEHTDRDLKAEDELLKKQEEAGVVV